MIYNLKKLFAIQGLVLLRSEKTQRKYDDIFVGDVVQPTLSVKVNKKFKVRALRKYYSVIIY